MIQIVWNPGRVSLLAPYLVAFSRVVQAYPRALRCISASVSFLYPYVVVHFAPTFLTRAIGFIGTAEHRMRSSTLQAHDRADAWSSIGAGVTRSAAEGIGQVGGSQRASLPAREEKTVGR